MPQYCSRDERDATAAEVGTGGLLRYVGTGEPVHTLSAEDSAMLVGAKALQLLRPLERPLHCATGRSNPHSVHTAAALQCKSGQRRHLNVS
jgi:hypothetical protein